MLIFLVKPQVLQTSVSSSNALPGSTGVTRAMTSSVLHCVQDAQPSGSGGCSFEAKRFPPNSAFNSSRGAMRSQIAEGDQPLLIFVP